MDDDAPKVISLTIKPQLSAEALGNEELCMSSFFKFGVEAADDKNSTWWLEEKDLELSADPPVKFKTGDFMKAFSPLQEHPELLGLPVKITATYLPSDGSVKKGPSGEFTVQQNLECGMSLELPLRGDEGRAGHDGHGNGAQGETGKDGDAAHAAEVEVAQVQINGTPIIMAIARIEGDDFFTYALHKLDEKYRLAIETAGGTGGKGGTGGRGVPGYDDNGNCRGNGAGGVGGPGGTGGNGGNGANLTLRVASKGLLPRVRASADGGTGGAGGNPGKGGDPCSQSSNPGPVGEPGKTGNRGKAATLTTKVVPPAKLVFFAEFLAKHPNVKLVEQP